jgi:hypothetical protein
MDRSRKKSVLVSIIYKKSCMPILSLILGDMLHNL